MRLIIRNDFDAVSRWAAEYVAARIRAFAPTEGRRFTLGLPTGSSPEGMYRELAAMRAAGSLSFRHVETFNMDEYVGLGADHPQSYRHYMKTRFFSKVDIDPANAHVPDGLAKDLAEECAGYERLIESAGGIELFVGGVGPDGHIAFNEPGSSLASRTRLKTLTTETRMANSRFFGGDPSLVPACAITVGVGTVLAAREILLLVSGHQKARALRAMVEEGVNHLWTASCLQLHPRAVVVCDEASTDELMVKTVRYFKDIESSLADERE